MSLPRRQRRKALYCQFFTQEQHELSVLSSSDPTRRSGACPPFIHQETDAQRFRAFGKSRDGGKSTPTGPPVFPSGVDDAQSGSKAPSTAEQLEGGPARRWLFPPSSTGSGACDCACHYGERAEERKKHHLLYFSTQTTCSPVLLGS